MSIKLRNLLCGVYLVCIIALLIGAAATRTRGVDIHLHDTYWVMNGLIILLPFALMLSMLLIIHFVAYRVLRYPLLNGLQALGTPLLIGLVLYLAFRAGLFREGGVGRTFIDLSDRDSVLVLTLKALLYWQLLLPLNILLTLLSKWLTRNPQ